MKQSYFWMSTGIHIIYVSILGLFTLSRGSLALINNSLYNFFTILFILMYAFSIFASVLLYRRTEQKIHIIYPYIYSFIFHITGFIVPVFVFVTISSGYGLVLIVPIILLICPSLFLTFSLISQLSKISRKEEKKKIYKSKSLRNQENEEEIEEGESMQQKGYDENNNTGLIIIGIICVITLLLLIKNIFL